MLRVLRKKEAVQYKEYIPSPDQEIEFESDFGSFKEYLFNLESNQFNGLKVFKRSDREDDDTHVVVLLEKEGKVHYVRFGKECVVHIKNYDESPRKLINRDIDDSLVDDFIDINLKNSTSLNFYNNRMYGYTYHLNPSRLSEADMKPENMLEYFNNFREEIEDFLYNN